MSRCWLDGNMYLRCLLVVLCVSLWGYEVSIEGDLSDELRDTLVEVSYLYANRSKAPMSIPALDQRIHTDTKNLLQHMHEAGFLDAKIHVVYEGDLPDVKLVIHIDPGSPYRFGKIMIAGGAALSCTPPSSPVSGEVIRALEKQFIEQLQEKGFPFCSIVKKEARVDPENKTCDVTYTVEQGPKVYFGSTVIQGLETVARSTVENKIAWKEHQLYHPQLIANTKKQLEKTGLFSFIAIDLGSQDLSEALPITIRCVETKHRHISAGINYTSDQMIGAEASWMHDNFTGKGDRLYAIFESSMPTQKGALYYEYPELLGKAHSFFIGGEVSKKRFSSIQELELMAFTRACKEFSHMKWNYSVVYEISLSGHAPYHLLSFPLLIESNRSPIACFSRVPLLRYHFIPYRSLLDPYAFYKHDVSLGVMLPLTSRGYFYLYGTCQMVSLFGDTGSIPLSKRLYGGSENHLKGYKYMTISPYIDGKPTGGLSSTLFEISGYLQCFHNFYLVPFFGIGDVYEGSWPSLTRKPLRCLGIGGCYLSSFGPLQVKIGIPLDRRSGIDEPFQLYFSLGKI